MDRMCPEHAAAPKPAAARLHLTLPCPAAAAKSISVAGRWIASRIFTAIVPYPVLCSVANG